jgi:hypothetical protein
MSEYFKSNTWLQTNINGVWNSSIFGVYHFFMFICSPLVKINFSYWLLFSFFHIFRGSVRKSFHKYINQRARYLTKKKNKNTNYNLNYTFRKGLIKILNLQLNIEIRGDKKLKNQKNWENQKKITEKTES